MAAQLFHLLVALLFLFLVFETFPDQVQSRNLKHERHPIKFLKNLKGSYKGQTVKGLKELKRYLISFGYLNSNDLKNTDLNDDFDDLLESALKIYQKKYHLNVTGSLESKTIEEMMVKRCGNPDIVHHSSSKTIDTDHKHGLHMVSHFSFFDGRPRWPTSQTRLTYTFLTSSVTMIRLEELRSVISRAFKRWADVSPLTFEEATRGAKADIQIGFYKGEHGDQGSFDGPSNVLAHAFAPRNGRFHLDADERWSTKPGPNEVDLESVAVHEIGHLLGLGHSEDRNAIMFAEFPIGTVKRDLNQDDINGIRNLYPS